ncbi:MAG: N-acetylneuraminate synthase [Candidatus Rokubacteria bacterium]|nr:N-acetylneuraminate synthase [Candidatus Rokubacteria bacterium]
MRFALGGREIGEGLPPFVIAEAGVNHNGDLGLALELVRRAKASGADCVKFQTFSAERLVTRAAPKAEYQTRVTDAAESQFAMLQRLELSPEAHERILAECRAQGILFLSTPYGPQDADLLERLGVEGFKIASSQLTEPAYLAHVARKGKPVILSTGMATLGEVGEALGAARATGNRRVVLLQCTTNYPSRIEDANLRVMDTLRAAFGVLVGYSDHTSGIVAAVAAAALGACVIEKHFTLDTALPGPDHSASADPAELARLVAAVREAHAALGSAEKRPTEAERRNAVGMRRSIVAARAIKAGTVVTADMLTLKRPATGLPPRLLPLATGRTARRDLAADAPIGLDDLV